MWEVKATLREYIDLVIKNKGGTECLPRVFGCLYWKSCFSSWCWKWPDLSEFRGGYTRFHEAVGNWGRAILKAKKRGKFATLDTSAWRVT